MAETAAHIARPTKIILASVAYVIISHPMHMGIQADIIVPLLPKKAHIGDDNGAATTAAKGTMLPIIYNKDMASINLVIAQ